MWIIWPFSKKHFGLAWTVCEDFRRSIDDSIGIFVIQDEKFLPHPKRVIFESICVLLYSETSERVLESTKLCAFELAFFQEDVGDQPLHPLGIARIGNDVDDVDRTYARSSVTDPSGKEKYDRFKALRDVEWERMKGTIAKILDGERVSARDL